MGGFKKALRLTADMIERRDRLRERLDKAGVPADPDPEHTKATGCRIGGRLGWLIDKADPRGEGPNQGG